MDVILLMHCLIWFANILLRIFATIVVKDTGEGPHFHVAKLKNCMPVIYFPNSMNSLWN